MISETTKQLTAIIYKILLQPTLAESVKERGYDFICEIMRHAQPEVMQASQNDPRSSGCNLVQLPSADLTHP